VDIWSEEAFLRVKVAFGELEDTYLGIGRLLFELQVGFTASQR
jgi:hypothetical protein